MADGDIAIASHLLDHCPAEDARPHSLILSSTISSSTTILVHEDSSLDPFYLERALNSNTRMSFDQLTPDDDDIAFERLENEYFMSYMTEESPPVEVKAIERAEKVNRSPVSRRRRHPVLRYPQDRIHCSQGSCSSIMTDATGSTPDLTPSSSFSSSYSVANCPEAVWRATEQLALHSLNQRRGGSQSAAKFYLPVNTPPVTPCQSRSGTRPVTPADNITACVDPSRSPLKKAKMNVKDTPPSAASSLRSKPLPHAPALSSTASAPRKSLSPGPRTPIDPSLISSPILIDPVTMEPHASHFDHAMFIPAAESPSSVPNPTGPSPPIFRQMTATSSKGRPSTSTSIAGEQSVWESDSESDSITDKSTFRRGPIDTLRKVRSRVQLRRAARSDVKLAADVPDVPTEPIPSAVPAQIGNQVYLQPQVAVSVTSIPEVLKFPPFPVKQTLRLVAPSTTCLPRPQSQKSSDKGPGRIHNVTAPGILAKSGREPKPHGQGGYSAFLQDDLLEKHCEDESIHFNPDSVLTLGRPGMFKRVWGSLRALNCRCEGS
jgi:hypothetical protein